MKKVEERDGKVFIDGVEYTKSKVSKQVFGVDLEDVYRIIDCLQPDLGQESFIEYKRIKYISRYSDGTRRAILNLELALAIKRLVEIGLEKLEEDNERVKMSTTQTYLSGPTWSIKENK